MSQQQPTVEPTTVQTPEVTTTPTTESTGPLGGLLGAASSLLHKVEDVVLGTTESIKEKVHETIVEPIEKTAQMTEDVIRKSVNTTMGTIKDTVDTAGQKVISTFQDTTHKAQESAENLQHQMGENAVQAKEKVQEVTHKVSETVSAATSNVQKKGTQMMSTMKEQGTTAQQKMHDLGQQTQTKVHEMTQNLPSMPAMPAMPAVPSVPSMESAKQMLSDLTSDVARKLHLPGAPTQSTTGSQQTLQPGQSGASQEVVDATKTEMIPPVIPVGTSIETGQGTTTIIADTTLLAPATTGTDSLVRDTLTGSTGADIGTSPAVNLVGTVNTEEQLKYKQALDETVTPHHPNQEKPHIQSTKEFPPLGDTSGQPHLSTGSAWQDATKTHHLVEDLSAGSTQRVVEDRR